MLFKPCSKSSFAAFRKSPTPGDLGLGSYAQEQSRVVQRMEQGLVRGFLCSGVPGPHPRQDTAPPPSHFHGAPAGAALVCPPLQIGGAGLPPPPPMVPHPCPARKATICAVISCIRHELQCLIMRVCMAMVMVAASYSFDGADDEDDDDNDDVEHDVKNDLIVYLRRCLEQHNIMRGTAGATARRKIRCNT